MWLLDMNMPKGLVAALGKLGVKSEHASLRGWGDLKNGKLVEAAADAGFTCLLTRDRLFGESASRTLKRFPGFAVVLVTLPQLRWPNFRTAFQHNWEEVPIRPEAGRLSQWPV
jgi:hypothetical protein